jgi:hypothetical protein
VRRPDVVDELGRGLPQRTLDRFFPADLRALQGLAVLAAK